ncbi:DUF4232 domain-containing protein [Streptomyces antibioticus]|uniref:DUF4232 domain-containing protein n=1 Tax=Streptomyces antibioticus TaxID=1890 RepID=A0AAE6YG73_STRAT|nr:DUF4232 domain-containing protein [Streptomyces antibioticus]QIT49021.1 DUF4232 domain-containing protein [Streptomyces antibioticus]
MHIRRTRSLLAVTALTALALTACENGTGTRDEGASALPETPSTSASAPASAPAAPADGGTTTPAKNGNKDGNKDGTKDGTKDNAKGGSKTPAPATRVLCNGSTTKVTAQPVPRPLNHLLLTVTNTGSKTCDLTYYPVLRFDEMQWVPRAAEETHPQAVVTLAPGESGYAGVLLSAADGSGDGGTTAEKLTVAFQGMTPNSDGGASATPALPAAGVYYDSSLTVTYWQQDREDALSW